MKKKIPMLLLLGATLLLLLCGCKTPAEKTKAPSPELPENTEGLTTGDFNDAVSEMDALENIDADTYVRNALNADAFSAVLQDGKDSAVRLRTDDAANIEIPAGDHTGKTLVFEAANASVTSDAALGTVIVNEIGEGGVTLNGGVKTLAVYGENVTVTLGGGADTVYVRGKNCTVRLAGGEFGEIISMNQTAVIENSTESDVTVYMANGAPQTLAAGDTLKY